MGIIDDLVRKNAKDRGFSEKDIDQALKELKEEGLIRKSDHVGYDDNMQLTPTGSKLIESELIKRYGEFKKVMDMESGKSHKVPTVVIIREGINQHDLKNFPEWTD